MGVKRGPGGGLAPLRIGPAVADRCIEDGIFPSLRRLDLRVQQEMITEVRARRRG